MKKILTFIAGIVIGLAIMYLGLIPSSGSLLATGPIKYNCELSGGTFQNNSCSCPRGEDQSPEEKYDKQTGFCQSDIGGPAGNAFQASIGLPYGEYSYYQNIIMNLCTNSGGSLSGAACICPSGNSYDKTTGKCK